MSAFGAATKMLVAAASMLAAASATVDIAWTATQRDKGGELKLLEDQKPITFAPMPSKPAEKSLVVDWTKTYQEIVGFGGAFTEASAVNFKALSKHDQQKVMSLYFDDPSKDSLGYTLGRVPINSCDFSPASYNFDNVTGDDALAHFDDSVKHDVDAGMIPMILDAQARVAKRGYELKMFASPWSPPAWMKLPVEGATPARSMLTSATPNGLDPKHSRAWANYFSRFISAYRKQGIDLWGVTVQNEPEAAVGWEACLWTPQFMMEFVRDHLGPVLRKEQPKVKIIGFDHNKDHVHIWADAAYSDPKAREYFDGMGVHWYGGLNTHNLENTHNLAPDKFILATEACNCGGVVYKTGAFANGVYTPGGATSLAEWWYRAESIALDILEDLKFWSVGWTDWNLLLSTSGGPNHLKNLCDANLIADPTNSLGLGTLIVQASYYYMGHFSRYIPPGSKRIDVQNLVETHTPALTADEVKNGQPLLFAPCNGDDVQKWTLDDTGSLIIVGTNEAEASDGYQHGGECMDMPTDGWPANKLQVWGCAHSPNQTWKAKKVDGGWQLTNEANDVCLTATRTSGVAVGLDAGVTITAAQTDPCLADGAPSQTFVLDNYDGTGYPSTPEHFPVRTADSLCLQPQIARVPHFDAVGFLTPDDTVTVVALNIGDQPITMTLHDAASKLGTAGLTVPAHAIHTYRWPVDVNAAAAAAAPAAADVAAAEPATITLVATDALDELPKAAAAGGGAIGALAFVAVGALVVVGALRLGGGERQQLYALLTGGRARVTDRHRALAQAWLDERADDSAAYREFGGRSGAYTPPQTRSGSAYGPVGSEM